MLQGCTFTIDDSQGMEINHSLMIQPEVYDSLGKKHIIPFSKYSFIDKVVVIP